MSMHRPDEAQSNRTTELYKWIERTLDEAQRYTTISLYLCAMKQQIIIDETKRGEYPFSLLWEKIPKLKTSKFGRHELFPNETIPKVNIPNEKILDFSRT